jgi:hypothetical protein
MGVTERAVFRASPEDSGVTLIDKQVWIESDIYGLRSAIKKFGVDRFKKNSVAANAGFSWALNRLYGRNNSPSSASLKNCIQNKSETGLKQRMTTLPS